MQKIYNNNYFGLLLGISGYSLFVFLDTIIKKYLVQQYPIFEITFFICLFSFIPILITLTAVGNWKGLINNKIQKYDLLSSSRLLRLINNPNNQDIPAKNVASVKTKPKSRLSLKTLQSIKRTIMNIAPLEICLPNVKTLVVKKTHPEKESKPKQTRNTNI